MSDAADDGLDDLGDFVDPFEDDDVEEPEGLRAALAGTFGASDAAAVTIEVHAPIGDLWPFAAHHARRSVAGLWADGRLDLDAAQCTQRVTLAWGYGTTTRVDPAHVASVVGLFEGAPGAPFLDVEAIELGGDPATMAPPVEIEDGEAVGVRFWNGSARQPPHVVTYLVAPDGRATVTTP